MVLNSGGVVLLLSLLLSLIPDPFLLRFEADILVDMPNANLLLYSRPDLLERVLECLYQEERLGVSKQKRTRENLPSQSQ